MWNLVGSRVAQAVATAWAIATLCFVLVHALPGDLALNIAVARVGGERATESLVARVRADEGLDRPLAAQYAQWIARAAAFDFGNSLISRKPVTEELAWHVRLTFGLGAAGWLLSYLLALPLGIAAGSRPGGWIDRATTAFAVTLASLPTFLVGIGLIGVFALTLRWLPPAGFRTGWYIILPAITLALGLAAFSVPVVRNAVLEVRRAFFLTFARVRGMPEAVAFRRHGIRNAAIPVVTYAAIQFAVVVDGFVVVETLFNYPGLGDLLVRSLVARDIPVIMGAGLAIGVTYALVNLLADLIALQLDPRRKAGAA